MSGQNLLMHVDLVARKEWIEREKEREKVEFPLKRGEGREIKGKGDRGKRKKIPKSHLWLKGRK